ncbi:MAG TPA: choice-of-anchor tandem repeat GloVer-containing protein, partial [Verrucomicrobiae bacterium]|nr:choice-of-anchor tandem repeat GloVer-containing protein [Verrucomicrobiae bacterium]
YGTLVAGGATLYGTTSGGGQHRNGTVFKMNVNGTGFEVLRPLATADGANPRAGLVLSGTTLYGTAPYGGVNDHGTVFKLNTDGTGFTVLKELFDEDGGFLPWGGLTLSGTTLYGTALVKFVMGGAVFKLETDGGGYEVIKQLGAPDEGLNPLASLWLADSVLYGTTWAGGTENLGTIFKLNTDGSDFATVKSFAHSRQGVNPQGGLVLAGSRLYGTTQNSADIDLGTVYGLNTGGGGFEVLHSFQGSATSATDGAAPQSGLALADGVFFGTTPQGGESNEGTIYRFDSQSGDYSVLKSFSSWTDGLNPVGPVTVSGGVLYGTTTSGGGGYGSVFRIDTNGAGFAVLKNFDGGADGGAPESGLVADGDTLYGSAAFGGSAGAGTIFKLGMDGGNFTLIKDYDGTDGAWPRAGLALSGEWLYGQTEAGGGFGYGTIFKLRTNGTGYTVLKDLDGFTEGGAPRHALVVVATTLYGCTAVGGGNNCGTVFKLNTDGSGFALLKDFSLYDGAYPTGSLIYADGVLYGTTSAGGQLSQGVVFSISLAPGLRVERASPHGMLLAWPHPSAGFELQQRADLGTGQWSGPAAVPVQVGDEWQVTVSPASGNRFYRLFKQ